MKPWALGSGLALSLLLARAAAAQDAPRAGEAVRVVISGVAAGARLRVSEAKGGHTIADCRGRCDFFAAPGRYTVYTQSPETGVHHELGLRVSRSSRFELQEGDATARYAGLTLGIAGPVAILTGVILIMPALLSSICEDSDCTSDGEQRAAQLGVGLLVLGAVATPVGWVIFASNRTQLAPLDADVGERRLGVASLRVGFGSVAPGVFGLASVAHF
jgi:hypothetical protein